MPELPEVETVRRGLAPFLEAMTIDHAEARRPDLRWPLPDAFAERLTGRRVAALRRRSKYLLADLDDGVTWLAHLGMSGRFTILPRSGAAPAASAAFALAAPMAEGEGDGPHDHVVVDTAAARLVYTDARRFGAMDLHRTADLDAHRWIAPLGPEPLSPAFTAAFLTRRLAGRVASIKAMLLDQRIVAGLGNIYVCESLWRARVDPRRPAGQLPARRVSAVVDAVRAVLDDAIAAGGSSLRDYRQADGALGYFQHSFAVYGRAGEVCRRAGCGGEIVREVQNARSSFFCQACQR